MTATTDLMRRCVQRRFRDEPGAIDTAALFREVQVIAPETRSHELSGALLDLMDEKVVKWDGGFRLVPAIPATPPVPLAAESGNKVAEGEESGTHVLRSSTGQIIASGTAERMHAVAKELRGYEPIHFGVPVSVAVESATGVSCER